MNHYCGDKFGCMGVEWYLQQIPLESVQERLNELVICWVLFAFVDNSI